MVALLNKVDCPYDNFQKVKIFTFKWCHWVFLVNFALCKKKKKKSITVSELERNGELFQFQKLSFGWGNSYRGIKWTQWRKLLRIWTAFDNHRVGRSWAVLHCFHSLLFSLSFLLSGLLSWVQMGFTDNFRIAYFFLLICILFISIDVDFIYLLSNHRESLDRDYIKMSILLLLH